MSAKLSQPEIDAVVAHLKRIAPNFSCRVCGKDEFSVYDSMTALPAISLKQPDVTRHFYPAILTVCMTCGHVEQFVPTPRLLSALEALREEENNG